MSFRLSCTIFLLLSVCAFPLYFTLGVGIFSVIWFRDYYELIPLFFLNDVLYGVPMNHFFHFPYFMTALAAVLVLVSVIVRRQVSDTGMSHI